MQASAPCQQIAACELHPPTSRPKTTAVVAKRFLFNALNNREILDLVSCLFSTLLSELTNETKLFDSARLVCPYATTDENNPVPAVCLPGFMVLLVVPIGHEELTSFSSIVSTTHVNSCTNLKLFALHEVLSSVDGYGKDSLQERISNGGRPGKCLAVGKRQSGLDTLRAFKLLIANSLDCRKS